MAFKNLEQRYNENTKKLYAGAKTKFEDGRPSRGASDDPILVRSPGENQKGIKTEGRGVPFISGPRDVKRLTLFQVSNRGIQFLAKQQLLQTGNTFESTRFINPGFVVSNALPFTRNRRHLYPVNALTLIGNNLPGILGKISRKISKENVDTSYLGLQKIGQLQKETYDKYAGGGLLGGLFKKILNMTPIGKVVSAVTAKRSVGDGIKEFKQSRPELTSKDPFGGVVGVALSAFGLGGLSGLFDTGYVVVQQMMQVSNKSTKFSVGKLRTEEISNFVPKYGPSVIKRQYVYYLKPNRAPQGSTGIDLAAAAASNIGSIRGSDYFAYFTLSPTAKWIKGKPAYTMEENGRADYLTNASDIRKKYDTSQKATDVKELQFGTYYRNPTSFGNADDYRKDSSIGVNAIDESQYAGPIRTEKLTGFIQGVDLAAFEDPELGISFPGSQLSSENLGDNLENKWKQNVESTVNGSISAEQTIQDLFFKEVTSNKIETQPFLKYFIAGDQESIINRGTLQDGTQNARTLGKTARNRKSGKTISYVRDPLNQIAEPSNASVDTPYQRLPSPTAESDPVIVSIAMGKSGHVQFRAFITDLQELVTPEYKSYQYIGRTEKFINYTSVQRKATFKLGVIAFSKDELDSVWTRINYLTGLLFPYGFNDGILQPNIIRLTIGNVYHDQPGYITSLNTNFKEISESWDIDKQVPMAATVYIDFILVEKATKIAKSPFYHITENIPGFEKKIVLPAAVTDQAKENDPPAPADEPVQVNQSETRKPVGYPPPPKPPVNSFQERYDTTLRDPTKIDPSKITLGPGFQATPPPSTNSTSRDTILRKRAPGTPTVGPQP